MTHILNSSINDDAIDADLVDLDGQIRKFSLFSLVSAITFGLLSTFFIITFYQNPVNPITTFLLIGDIIIFLIFLIFLEKFLSLKEEQVKLEFLVLQGQTSSLLENEGIDEALTDTGVIGGCNKIFGILENFPYIEKKRGMKKLILQIVGWIGIVLIFSISTIIRVVVEFADIFTTINKLGYWATYFTFYIFVLAAGAFVLYLTSKQNPYKIFKLAIFGVAILIQLPVWIDYFFRPESLPYSYIHWEDFFKAFGSFLTHPDISYATGIGYAFMLLALIILFSLYTLVKRIDYASQYESNWKWVFVSSRTVLSGFLIYSLVLFTSISHAVVVNLLKLVDLYTIEYLRFFLFDLYIIPLFLYLIFATIWKARKRDSEVNIRRKLAIKLGIIGGAFVAYYVVKVLIVWIFPNLTFMGG